MRPSDEIRAAMLFYHVAIQWKRQQPKDMGQRALVLSDVLRHGTCTCTLNGRMVKWFKMYFVVWVMWLYDGVAFVLAKIYDPCVKIRERMFLPSSILRIAPAHPWSALLVNLLSHFALNQASSGQWATLPGSFLTRRHRVVAIRPRISNPPIELSSKCLGYQEGCTSILTGTAGKIFEVLK